jgi:hypothetical protein
MSNAAAFPNETSSDQPRMLELGERIFIWGMRARAQYHLCGQPTLAAMEEVYAQFHVEDAIAPLDTLVEAFACAALTTIGLHNPCCPCLSVSEASLLRAMALAQTCHLRAARREFERWLPELAAEWVLHPACTIGRMFQTEGMLLPLRDAQLATPIFTREFGPAGRM